MRNLIQGKRTLVILTDGECSRLNSVEQDDDALIITVREEWDADQRLAYAKEVLRMWADARKK